MIDHIGIEVSNYEQAKYFYQQVLAPLGYELLMEVNGFAGFGLMQASGPIANFWLNQASSISTKIHIAFTAQSRKVVDDFYETAIKIGGRDNGKPGIRAIYHPNYYGAFILDADGYNIRLLSKLYC